VTRKSAVQESLAFCTPVKELNLAIDKVVTFSHDAIERAQSRHRLILVVKELGGSGALYTSVISLQRQKGSGEPNAKMASGFYDAAVAHLEKQTFPRLRAEVARVNCKPQLAQGHPGETRVSARNKNRHPGRAAARPSACQLDWPGRQCLGWSIVR
jgi:hypothetical protein